MQPAAAPQPPPIEHEELPIYALPPDEVFLRLDGSPNGLTDEEAAARLARYGPNQLEEVRKVSPVAIFVGNLFNFFAILLWVAAALALLSGSVTSAVAIVAVILINGVFAFWQEYKAEKAVEALRRMLPRRARVVRGGRDRVVDAGDLVPGDLVLLSEGDPVSADARLVEAFRLATDNATLTGE
ncbi:MAG: cation-transporting P-type ATPase, partial [Chloroflexota bacterium]